MISFTNYQNADATVIKLLKSLHLEIAPSTVMEEMEKHPDYPSLLAISDVLTALKVDNSAFRIDYDGLTRVTCPFIVHTNSNGGDFLLVDKIEAGTVTVSNDKWNKHKLSSEEFKQLFAGVILNAQPSLAAVSKAPALSAILASAKIPLVATGLLLILVSALIFHTDYLTTLNWQLLLLTLFKSAGLITSILLLVQSIDSNNPLIQKLCQSNSKTNCNAILSSKAAKVFEGLTWSEVGFFYFTGTWLLLLFGGSSQATWHLLALLNFVSLPYTVYSIYYQARVAKQWCVLCCTVQALLWLEFVPLVIYTNKNLLSLGEGWGEAISGLFIAILLPVILWVMIKPLFLKAQQLQPLKQQLRTFKYNNELFNSLLKEQPKYAMPDESWSIVLGNVEASNSITMVTNPYCPPCSNTHKMLDELLEHRDDLQARIVFTANNTDNDIKTPVSRHLMALNALPDKSIVKRALNDWYEQKQKNYDAWAKVYPVALNGAEHTKIDHQKAWCEMAEVKATPTLLLNGYRLPDLYRLQDLKYMLE